MSTTKVYTTGETATKGYHLGSNSNQITENAKPSDAVPHSGNSFAQIQKECLASDELYKDEEFPAIDSSLFFSKKPPRPFQWKRPSEIVDNPSLFVEGASRFDISQGMLGDCWLLAAVASLCQQQSLLHQVVPTDQTLDPNKPGYCGAVRFRFWQYGKWEEVTVDDRLPTYNNKLVFLHSNDNNEFWSALLEKAYAKLCGTYEALKGGQTSEAMEDFTGGVTETFDLAQVDDGFFKLLLQAEKKQSLMCCSIEAKPNEIEAKLDNGLIKGHAYTVTNVEKVAGNRGELQLMRVRNPWGNEKEWTGAWSDGSDEWKQVSDEQKKHIGLSDADDGEFWMSYDDFKANFSKVEVCMLSPDSAGDIGEGGKKNAWAMEINQGTWQAHLSAGGCRNFPDSFHLNPQYMVDLKDPDEDEDDLCTIVIGCIQRGRRKQKRVGSQNLTIGFSIYKLGDDYKQYVADDRLSKEYFLYHKSEARSKNFVNAREVTGRFALHAGKYVIIPSTFKNNEEGDFVLRMFSEKPQAASTMDTKTTITYKEKKKLTDEERKVIDAQLKGFFEKVAGVDEEIDAFELRQILNLMLKNENMKELSIESCRAMISMVDQDRNGKLDYEEFVECWLQYQIYKNAFKVYDEDKSGDCSAPELRQLLSNLGFALCTPIVSSLVLRYANKAGRVEFDDVVQVACRVKSSFLSYQSYQNKKFSLDDYMLSAIYT